MSHSNITPRVGTKNGPRVKVEAADGSHRVVASEEIDAGMEVLEVCGVLVDRPSRYTIQVEAGAHIELPLAAIRSGELNSHPWRYLNHSCRPNAALSGLQLLAISPIRTGEEVTFDYNTTEFEMAAPFMCRCGHCGGVPVRGFKFLSAAEQRALYPRLAVHLRRTLNRDGIC